MYTNTFFTNVILFNKMYVLQGLFIYKSCMGECKFCQLCLILPKKYTVSYIRTTRNLAGPPDFQGWWSDGPLSRNVNF